MELFAGTAAGFAGLQSMVTGMLSGAGLAITLAVTAYSLLQCYFGYIIFRVLLVIQGVINGLGIGALIGSGITVAANIGGGGGIAVIVTAAVISGIAGGLMAHFLYKFGVFMYYFVIVGLIAAGIGYAIGHSIVSALAPGIIAGILAGILGVIFDKPIIIVTTGLFFGISAGSNIGTMTGQLWVTIVLSIIFVVTGIMVQTALTKKKESKKAIAANQQAAAPISQPFYMQAPTASVPQNTVSYPNNAAAQNTAASAVNKDRFCTFCGAKLNPNASFCEYCGNKIE